MDTVFLTGASGFVGSNLARLLLERGYRVRALVRSEAWPRVLRDLDVERVRGDVLEPSSLEAACRGARFVFHVAADYRIWVPDPRAMYAVNVQGTENVLAAAAAAGVERSVHCSSVATVRPPAPGSGACSDESSEYGREGEIIGPYKRSKWLAERLARARAARGEPVVIVNPTAPIGPQDLKPTPTGRIVLDFLNRRMPSYVDTGLNVVHVRDVAEGHLQAALRGRPGERYILGGENLTLKSILDLLAEITGLRAPRFKTPYVLALAFAAADSARAALLGGEPRAPLDALRMARARMFYDSGKAVRELGLPRTGARRALEDAALWFYEHGYVRGGWSPRRASAKVPA